MSLTRITARIMPASIPRREGRGKTGRMVEMHRQEFGEGNMRSSPAGLFVSVVANPRNAEPTNQKKAIGPPEPMA
jgi:hypothetical protein